MHLDHQPVGSNRNRRLGQRRYHEGQPGRMARVNNNRQVGHLFEHRHRRKVQRVAHARFKSTDAPLAEYDVRVSFSHDVLGAHDKFFQGAGQPALEQHRHIQFADRFEQLKVLHIARADLDHIDPGFQKKRDVGGVHQFGHNWLAGHSPGFLQQRKPFGTQPLKAVRACARLERTAAQNRSAGGLHPLGNAGDLFLAFNAAGAGHHGEMPAANFDRVFAADGDDRIVRVEFAVGFFIRFRDAAAALN